MAIARQPEENKVAHAMATHNRLATHAWRHRINLKQHFVDESTHESVDAICKTAIRKLSFVIESEKSRSDQKNTDERDYFVQQLENVSGDFDALIGAVEGESVEDRVEQFNYTLAQLYDIGDTKIELLGGMLQKFLWVN